MAHTQTAQAVAEPDFWDFLPAKRAGQMREACARAEEQRRQEAEVLAFAREWIADCMWADDVDASLLTDAQVKRGVEAHYDGGWQGLVYDASL